MTASSQPRDARRRNVAAIVRAVFLHESLPRTDIARVTGLTRGTVSKIVSLLTDSGLLVADTPSGESTWGRPSLPLTLDSTHRCVAGVHVGLLREGVLRVTAGLVNLRGEVLSLRRGLSEDFDPDNVVAVIRQLVETLPSWGQTLGVGVTLGGHVDVADGTVVEHDGLGWREVDFGARLAAGLHPPVHLDNTVRAMALAEMWFGAATAVDSLMEVFVGNIVGAALLTSRTVHYGPRSGAGRLSHYPLPAEAARPCRCGRRDCFQAVASDAAVMAEAQERGLLPQESTIGQLITRAREGHNGADRLLRRRARLVGEFVGTVLDLINPDRLVLAGGLLDTPEYLDELRDQALHRTRDPHDSERIHTSTLGEGTLVLGSAAPFLDRYYADPVAIDERLAANEPRAGTLVAGQPASSPS